MDAKVYLQSFGWKEGEALQTGGIRKPILVKHKKDTKGLGGDSNDGDMWWERVFDTQLTNLEVTKSTGGVTFKQNTDDIIRDLTRPNKSALYKMFVKGEGLKGTVGKVDQIIAKDFFDKDHTPDIVRKLEEKVDENITKIKKEKGNKKKGDKKEKGKKRKDDKEEKKKSGKDAIEKKDRKEKKKKRDKKEKDIIDKTEKKGKSKSDTKVKKSKSEGDKKSIDRIPKAEKIEKKKSKDKSDRKRSRTSDDDIDSKKKKKRL